jgi:hypothetical protein
MNTLEFKIQVPQFRQFVTGTQLANQSTFDVEPTVPAAVGHHVLLQEFDAKADFTGQWIRTRIVDVDATGARKVLTLKLIAKNSVSPMRRRAA